MINIIDFIRMNKVNSTAKYFNEAFQYYSYLVSIRTVPETKISQIFRQNNGTTCHVRNPKFDVNKWSK